ncbi:3-dehydroquinate synthase family protein [Streptomyces sp. NBC_00443]|uniref:3-dehydroquinate synthase family protein n=1 Tax=Streptomyces sp. NBC_00443 TaxID=2975743 RepID=UPI002E2267C2
MGLQDHPGGWSVVAARQVTYDVLLRSNVLDVDDPSALLDGSDPPARRLVVVDHRFWDRYRPQVETWLDRLAGQQRVITLPAHESAKTRDAVHAVVRAAIDFGMVRRDELLGIGGGIVLDIVGVAASELFKGIQYTALPTTLVGLIDAGLGGKRAVNHEGRKNLVGHYHPARRVILDPTFLRTLDARHISAGLAEIKKAAEMVDPRLLDLLDEHGADLLTSKFAHPVADEVIRRAAGGILEHLADDLFECQLRRWPDYGHTVSPTLEMDTNGAVVHGEAVNVCALLSTTLAAGRGLVDDAYTARMVRMSQSLGLPTYHDRLSDRDFLQRAIQGATRTRNGNQHWPVPTAPGFTFIEDATLDEVAEAARALRDLTGADR